MAEAQAVQLQGTEARVWRGQGLVGLKFAKPCSKVPEHWQLSPGAIIGKGVTDRNAADYAADVEELLAAEA